MADAVIDVEALGTPDAGAYQQQDGQQQQSQADQQAQKRADDKAYEEYLKGLREDPDNKFSRRLKDDFGRSKEIYRIDPKGIDGIRAHYDTLNGIAHGDKTGIDAVTSIQEALAESQTNLDAIAQGNFGSLGEEQRDGVLRMAPAIIDDLAESNPDAYSALLLPHFVEGLKSSALYSSLNGLLSSLNEKPPSWLTKEQIPTWTMEHISKVTGHAQNMAKWFDAQDQRVRELGGKDGTRPQMDRNGQTRATDNGQSGTANPEFWQRDVYPQTNQHAEETFNKELRPWAEKLAKAGIRLSDAKKQALVQEMVRDVTAASMKNPAYKNQMKRFNSQRSPDGASVISTFKTEFNRHAKTSLEALIRRDYGQVLDKGGPKPAAKQGNGSNGKPAPVQAGVKYVSAKPDRARIDFPNTPEDWIHISRYRMKDGSVEQYRP
jgi:hypothetical protein